jgi:hypothetical protein
VPSLHDFPRHAIETSPNSRCLGELQNGLGTQNNPQLIHGGSRLLDATQMDCQVLIQSVLVPTQRSMMQNLDDRFGTLKPRNGRRAWLFEEYFLSG